MWEYLFVDGMISAARWFDEADQMERALAYSNGKGGGLYRTCSTGETLLTEHLFRNGQLQ